MASEVFQLAILLSLKDAASGGLDRFSAKLRGVGKDGQIALQELDKIRNGLNRDLAIGGVGVAGMGLLYKGVQAAGDFQATMTDLSSSLATVGNDGKVNFDALGKDMLEAEAIAMRLGNALPGTTKDFAEMMQTLKQNGLATTTILNGAADAVANLAVANNAVPKEIAADFAQYGNLFKLKPEDFAPAADVFARIYSSTSQTSQELVEAAKYFEGRAGTSLGISGLKDAEQITRLFGMMGMKGMRGSIAGTSLTDFFHEYEKHADRIKELQKDTGIKLDFFDAKGKFAGMDTVFEQMKQFDKLSQKDRSGWLDKIFGLRGMSAANVFAQEGIEGWRKFNTEQDKTISLQDKVKSKAATFNNQMEALKGTLENLEVTVFSPMLPDLTAATQKGNDFVSSIQEFAKLHPDLVKGAVELAAYGSTALTVYSAFNLLSGGVKLFKLASSFSTSEGLLPYLSRAKEEAAQTSFRVAGFARPLENAAEKAGEVESRFKGIAKSSLFKVAIDTAAIMAAEVVITGFIEKYGEAVEKSKQVLDNAKSIREEYDRLMGTGASWNKPGDYGKDDKYKGAMDTQAGNLLESLKQGKDLERSLHPERFGWWESMSPTHLGHPHLDAGGNAADFDPSEAAQTLKRNGVSWAIQDPNLLARLIDKLDRGGLGENSNLGDIKIVKDLLASVAGKDKWTTANDILAKERGQSPQNKPSVTPFNQLFQYPNLMQTKNPFQTTSPLSGFNKNPFDLKPFSLDLNKPLAAITDKFNGFTPAIAGTEKTFTSLQTTGNTWQSGMLKVIETTGNTQKGLDDFRQHLNDTQPSLFRLVTSVNGVVNSLDGASRRISTLEISAPKIIPNSFTPSGNHSGSGIGVFTSLRESNRKDAEKRKTQYADLTRTVADNQQGSTRKEIATASVVVHYAPTNHFHGNASAKDFEASDKRNRLELGKMIVKAVKDGNQSA